MKRILLDQGFAVRTAALLRDQGWDAVHVTEAGLEKAADFEILEFARLEKRACVTLDHDFHAHLALAQAGGPSVVFVRLEGLDAIEQAELIQRTWTACEESISRGAAVSVDRVSVRIRRLPLR